VTIPVAAPPLARHDLAGYTIDNVIADGADHPRRFIIDDAVVMIENITAT